MRVLFSRAVLCAGLLLLSSVVARANVANTIQATTPRPPWGDELLKNPNAYNVLAPSGGDDWPQLQAAFTDSVNHPVKMLPGVFQSCKQLVMPTNGQVFGSYFPSWTTGTGSGGGTFAEVSYIECAAGWAGATDGSEDMIKTSNHTLLQNVGIHGMRDNGNPNVGCVGVRNVIGPMFVDSLAYRCKEGIRAYSDGNIPGPNNIVGQLLVLRGSLIVHNDHCGLYIAGVNTGANTDFIIDGNNFISNGNPGDTTAGDICADVFSNAQIINNRLEYANYSIQLSNAGYILISGNNFDRFTDPITISSSYGITIVGNEFDAATEWTSDAVFRVFSTTFGLINIGTNGYSGAWPNIFSGGGDLGNFSTISAISTQYNLYADDATKLGVDKYRVSHPSVAHNYGITSTTFDPPDWQYGFFPSFNLTSACAPCTLPNPSYSLGANGGTFVFAQDPAGSRTITFGSGYKNTPTLSSAGYAIDYVPWSSDSSGTIVFGTKVSIAPSSNLILGGNGLATDWTVNAATKTTNAHADPVGTSTAASFVENAADDGHYLNQTLSLSAFTDYTFCVWNNPSLSGNRKLKFLINDSGFSNYVAVLFGTSGNFEATFVSGGGNTVSGQDFQQANGFHRDCATFNLGGAPVSIYVQMQTTDISQNNYPGDGTSGIWLWGPTLRAGTSP